jgi:hypothetical protein
MASGDCRCTLLPDKRSARQWPFDSYSLPKSLSSMTECNSSMNLLKTLSFQASRSSCLTLFGRERQKSATRFSWIAHSLGIWKGHGWHTPSCASPAMILMSLSKNGSVVIGSTLAKTLPAKSSMEFVGRQSGMRTEEFLDSFAMPTPQGLSRTFVPLSQLTICWTKATTLFSFCPALLSTSDNMWFEVTLLFNRFSPFVSMAR